jgi:hypothetical protein
VKNRIDAFAAQVGRIIVGKERVARLVIACILARGQEPASAPADSRRCRNTLLRSRKPAAVAAPEVMRIDGARPSNV